MRALFELLPVTLGDNNDDMITEHEIVTTLSPMRAGDAVLINRLALRRR